MPIYEYRCRDCGATCEILVGAGQRQEIVSCRSCGSRELEKIMSAAAFVGPAAKRPAGRTCCGREERCDTPACATGGAGGGCGRHG